VLTLAATAEAKFDLMIGERLGERLGPG